MSDSSVFSQIQEALTSMSSSATDKAPALHYLEEFQKTPEAWTIVHSILADASYPLEMKMFAAQTLRNKFTYDLHQVPEASLPSLKDSTIEFLIQYSETNKPITTQLSIALSKLAIQYLSWSGAVEELMTKLQNNIPALLEFLKILPEETLDPKGTPLTDDEFRHRTEELIVDNVEKVLLLLSNYAQSTSNSKAKSLILDCLNSWIREIPVEQLLTVDALSKIIFESLQDEDSFEKASDCLISIIRESKDIQNLQLIQALYQQVINLKPLIQQYKDDPDMFGSFTRLFVEAGESWHTLIAKAPEDFKPLVEILLECTAYDEDLDIVKYTFYFWYNLKQMITLERFKHSREVYKPIYTQLIHIMIHHLKYPDGSDSSKLFSNSEEEDKFKDFRYDMGDVLKDCTAVVGSSNSLIIPFDKIKEALTTPNVKWQDVEAPLFSLRTMAKEVSTNENKVLPQIMDLLVQLPENSKIRYAATLVLGRYTEWTSKHPQYLEKQLNYIISGFQISDPDIITAAAHALMYFCQDCSTLLTDFIEQLYEFYINIFRSSIDIISLYDVTEGVAYVVGTLASENIGGAATMFIKPVLEKLSGYSNVAGSEELYNSIADEIEIIRKFIEVIKPRSSQATEDPIGNLIIEIWPIVLSLLEKHGASVKVSERCMKFTKTAVQTYSLFLTPILPSIANCLAEGFQKTRFGCYLWVSGAIIREFGDEYVPDDTKQAVWSFAYQQITTFMVVFKQATPRDIPDLIEDFSSMMNDIVMFFTVNFFLSDLLKPVFEVSLLALDIEKFEPLIVTLHFLIDFVSWGFDTPPISIYYEVPPEVKLTVQRFVAENGGLLLTQVLNGLIFKFPVDAHQEASDLLGKTIRLAPNPETAVAWVNNALNSLPANSVSDQERNKLITTISTSLTSKDYRRIRFSLKDFVSWYLRKNIRSRFQDKHN